ncbi:rhamnosidase [Intrasporangium oryzae NRRL B-24470]|uniref:alpha-L-rhamnosidase n=1 Tax=Intrasporangium oryzae NRRL B-24470 TaxID=1386089 RepID=W9G1V1_9MICO|nr:family 78 glycoside hydrolase catalytic domain [Intrasporangium oryzae]EWT00051.1 rhamnosidase [Intrasporangium oryzae NRRL B-24470]
MATPSATGGTTAASSAATGVTALRTNALVNPLGIPGAAPQLSWQLSSARRGVSQAAYEIRVGRTAGSADVWGSGRVASGSSVNVPYGGPALQSHTRYFWSVRVWDDTGTASDWSAPATFEAGLLSADEWTADWVSAVGATRYGPEWTDYRIDFTASRISGALGVYFRGRDTEHAYMWQLSEASKALRPHVKNGGYSVLAATPFPAGFSFADSHRYSIAVSGSTITTSVDGAVLDRRDDTTFAGPGIMGFRTSGAESGLVRDVTVTGADGKALVQTSFPSGDRSFTAGTVTPDGLQVEGNAGEAWVAVGNEVPLMRKEFEVADKPIASARIYASARGLYSLQLNGARVGDQELAPGMTDYSKRIAYQTYDVTSQLQPGTNAVGAEVANGWYAGKVAMFGTGVWGDRTSLLAQLRIVYADGTTQTVGTDGSWRATPGPRTSADLLDGESYDARRASAVGSWDKAGYDASAWRAVTVVPSATNLLEPQTDQPVRVTQELAAHRIASPTANTYLYDLGQNMVGRARVTLKGAAGTTARLRFAEVLNKDGSIYTANLRSAKATDYYTFGADGAGQYESRFTFHGFRYVEVTGVSEAPADSDIVGVVLGTDGPLVNEFETSSALVNRLHSNIEWGMRGNFLSIPTDTPARDERMGWTGDIDVFARTAVYNMDAQAFLSKWLKDLRDTQNAAGAFPGVAPVIPGRFDGGYGSAGWADAGVHVPWALWQAYGDTKVINDNYDAMKRYVDYLDRDSTNHIRSTGGYLDWLNLDDNTSADVLDTAFVARSTRELAEMADATGRKDDAATYRARLADITRAYQAAFIAADGTVKGDSQTAYILTINNGLVPADRKDLVAAKFVASIERRDWHLSTGFLGVDGLLPALTAIGRTDVAYRLLQNTDYPSWGYEIGKGATTVWERWNSIMPDGTFGPVEMNSFNHYAYGAVGEWMYRTLAGVSALEPGYRQSVIAPEPGAGVDWARMSHETPYGTIASSWRTGADGITLDVTVPANTTSEVHVPAPSRWAVLEGGAPASDAEGLTFLRMERGAAVFRAGSGAYHFTVDDVLGSIGEARAAVSGFTMPASITSGTANHLATQWDKLAREVEATWKARLAHDADTASLLHGALSTAADLRRWVETKQKAGGLTSAEAKAYLDVLSTVASRLSTASGRLVGAVVSLVPPDGALVQGGTGTVRVVVDNRGTETIRGIDATLTSPAGWTVQAVPGATEVAPGQRVSLDFTVTVAPDATPAAVELAAAASYQFHQSTATLPVSAMVTVAPAVVIDTVSGPSTPTEPGQSAVVTTVVRNQGATTRSRQLTLSLPDGWTAPAAQAFSVPAGSTATITSTVAVPLDLTTGTVPVTAAVGATDLEKASGSLRVVVPTPPASSTDHVDLGDATSEATHHLTASEHSGTSVEAGLTRRYSHSSYPGGWFEMDVTVPTDGPFALRMIETYDQSQTKTYDVLVNGQVVHQRRYTFSTTGQASLAYQFVVDRPDLVKGSVVRVRFQDVAGDYDPSIADLWAVPIG